MKFTVEDLPAGARSGRHHDRVIPVVERVRVDASKATLMSEDAEWLLAAALMHSITDDLAITHAAGWWHVHPAEMRCKCAEADAVLRELTSDAVAMLADLVAEGTHGSVQLRFGTLLRLAKKRARRFRHGALSMETVRQRIKLIETGRQIRMVATEENVSGSPYQRQRSAMRRQNGLCKTCDETVADGQVRCVACRKRYQAYKNAWKAARKSAGLCISCGAHAMNGLTRCSDCQRLHLLYEKKRSWRARNIPEGAMALKEWMKAEAARLGITYNGMRSRLQRGQLTLPPVVYRSRTRLYVLPEKEGRAA